MSLPSAELSALEELMVAHERACYGGEPVSAGGAARALHAAQGLLARGAAGAASLGVGASA